MANYKLTKINQLDYHYHLSSLEIHEIQYKLLQIPRYHIFKYNTYAWLQTHVERNTKIRFHFRNSQFAFLMHSNPNPNSDSIVVNVEIFSFEFRN
jgi:hypothetical protein